MSGTFDPPGGKLGPRRVKCPALGGTLDLTSVELRWTLGDGSGALVEHVSPPTPAPDGSVGLRVCVDGARLVAANTSAASAPGNVAVAATYEGAALTTEWLATTGESVVQMPSDLPKCSYATGCADTHDIAVTVTADAGARVRLVLARNFHRAQLLVQRAERRDHRAERRVDRGRRAVRPTAAGCHTSLSPAHSLDHTSS